MRKRKDKTFLKVRKSDQTKVINSFYKNVFPSLKRYILANNGNIQQAEDIFHDGIIILFQKDKISNNTIVDTDSYLYTVCRNLWINKARRDKKIIYNNDHILINDQIENDIEKHLLTKEKESAMEEILNKVGEQCKKLLKLTFYDNYSLEEAAVILNISNSEVAKTNKYRCKKKLMSLINDNEGFKKLMDIL